MEKGEPGPGFGAFPRWVEHQDSHGVRRKGTASALALTGGQASDAPQAIPLLSGIEAGSVIADKGYESNEILAFIQSKGATAVIPPKSNRKNPWEYDRGLYRERNLIERAFNN